MQGHPSRRWGHGNKTSHWRPGFLGQCILDPQENTIWITLTPPLLVQQNQRDSTQDGPQSLTNWTLPTFWCTCQPLLSWHHIRSSIPTKCRPLCQRFCILLLRSNPGGPIQNITPGTHPSQFHGRCWIFLRYCIYLAQTQRWEHLRSYMPIGIHWIHSSLVLG